MSRDKIGRVARVKGIYILRNKEKIYWIYRFIFENNKVRSEKKVEQHT